MPQDKSTEPSTAELLSKLNLSEEFKIERSHKASLTSNEHSRATAQACLLINGGAATAVLAYLAKDKIAPNIFDTLPWALFGYTLGVFAGAVMLFCATQAMDHYNRFWLWSVKNPDAQDTADAYANGKWWWDRYYASFALAGVLFVASNLAVAISIYCAKPPQEIPSGPPPQKSAPANPSPPQQKK